MPQEIDDSILGLFFYRTKMEVLLFPDRFGTWYCEKTGCSLQEVSTAISRTLMTSLEVETIREYSRELNPLGEFGEFLIFSFSEWRSGGSDPPWISVVDPEVSKRLNAIFENQNSFSQKKQKRKRGKSNAWV